MSGSAPSDIGDFVIGASPIGVQATPAPTTNNTLSIIIDQALKISGVLGVGQTAQATDLADALIHVNFILNDWRRKRWLNTNLVDVAIPATGAQSYSIGIGGDVNVDRPDRIVAAFLRYTVNTPVLDYPLRIIEAREIYNRIAIKSMVSWPAALYYDPAYPLGNIYVWPIPAAGLYEIHLSLKAGMEPISDPTLDLLLPPEYQDALMWTLAARMRPFYQLPPDPTIIAAMRIALDTIRTANAQLPTMRMPDGLPSRRGASSSIVDFIRGF